MKICSKCRQPKDLSQFVKNKQAKDGLYYQCKFCTKKYREKTKDAIKHYQKKYAEIEKQSIKEYQEKWRESNKLYTKEYNKKYKEENRQKIRALKKVYRDKYRGKMKAKKAKRTALKLKATPKWLNKEDFKQIEDFYKNCPKGYEVDHIIPLRGKNINGLHVLWNLQYLTQEENRVKSNKFDGTYENLSWKIDA